MPTKSEGYWFPAKRYGWGWGWPARWQGWVAFAVYAGLVAAGIAGLPPDLTPMGFVLYMLAVSALLVLVCWLEGRAAALVLEAGLNGPAAANMGVWH
jgi:hypothetical protein